MTKYLFLLSASALCAPAYAQDSSEDALAEIIAAQDDPSLDTSELDDGGCCYIAGERIERPSITVTANGLGTDIRNTGQAVTLIDTKEIDAVQGADPVRVLRRTPGLSFTRNGGMGGFTGVSLRGSASEQVLVLVDGVRVADPAAPGGGFDFGNLLLSSVGKFDILRGSNSTIWGSDAIGGVIDVTTRTETGLEGRVEYGSRDTLSASATGGLGGDSYFFGLKGSYLHTDGFSSVVDGGEPDGLEQYALGGAAFFDVTHNIELFAHANWSEADLDLDGFAPPTFAFADTLDTQETQRYWGDVGLAYYGNDLTLRAAYSLADTERYNFDGDGNVTFGGDGHSERLQLRGEYRVLGPLTLAFGAEHEWSDYVTLFDAPGSIETTGGYAQVGLAFGRLAAHVGGRVDDHELFGTKATYGADLSYGLGDDWRVRASLGEGFKAPTLYQLRSFYGNPELRPEASTSVDLGIEKGQRGQGVHAALTGFLRTTDDLIGFGFGPERPFGGYENVSRARAAGFELEGGFDVTPYLRVSGVFSHVDTEDRDSGLELARRPEYFGTLFADWETPFGLNLGGDVRFVSESFNDSANMTPLDGYEVVDLRASYPLGERFELFGRVENLFDADYTVVKDYNTPGRGAFVGLRARM